MTLHSYSWSPFKIFRSLTAHPKRFRLHLYKMVTNHFSHYFPNSSEKKNFSFEKNENTIFKWEKLSFRIIKFRLLVFVTLQQNVVKNNACPDSFNRNKLFLIATLHSWPFCYKRRNISRMWSSFQFLPETEIAKHTKLPVKSLAKQVFGINCRAHGCRYVFRVELTRMHTPTRFKNYLNH